VVELDCEKQATSFEKALGRAQQKPGSYVKGTTGGERKPCGKGGGLGRGKRGAWRTPPSNTSPGSWLTEGEVSTDSSTSPTSKFRGGGFQDRVPRKRGKGDGPS